MEYLIIGLFLLIFFIANYLFQKIRIPPILAYILLGTFLSPFFNINIQLLVDIIGDIGIMLLFFLLGLQYPLNYLINISRKIWQVGALDFFLNFMATFFLAYMFGFDLMAALILGGVAYATSSSITIKMLEDTGRAYTPEGEFKVGLLIFEDIVAPIMVSFIAGLSLDINITWNELALMTIKVFLLVLTSILMGLYGFRRIEFFVKRYLSKDFMLLFALAIAFLLAGISVYLELSKLLGAFLAGVVLAETRVTKELDDLISPIKNATLPFFFFWFGTTISIETGIIKPGILILLVLWGLIAKFMVGFFGGRMYNLTWKGSLRGAFSLGQRGEFSVIIAAIGDSFLHLFGGIYIIITALSGVFLFYKAPKYAENLNILFNKKIPRFFSNGNS